MGKDVIKSFMKVKMEKFGSFGAIVAAAACPICFPKLALIGAVFGFGFLAKYEVVFLYLAQIMVIVALIGHIISYQKLKHQYLLILASISTTLFFVSLYILVSEILSYVALAGLVAATIWMTFENRKCVSGVPSND